MKNFGLDWSHLSIQAGLLDAQGIEESSEWRFSQTSTSKPKLAACPSTAHPNWAFGSTDVARINWKV